MPYTPNCLTQRYLTLTASIASGRIRTRFQNIASAITDGFTSHIFIFIAHVDGGWRPSLLKAMKGKYSLYWAHDSAIFSMRFTSLFVALLANSHLQDTKSIQISSFTLLPLWLYGYLPPSSKAVNLKSQNFDYSPLNWNPRTRLRTVQYSSLPPRPERSRNNSLHKLSSWCLMMFGVFDSLWHPYHSWGAYATGWGAIKSFLMIFYRILKNLHTIQ